MTPLWMRLADESAAPSPALLVFPDRIEGDGAADSREVRSGCGPT